MRQFYLGFSTPKKYNLFSRLIMWVENRPFSHVYVRFHWSSTTDMIYQASKLAVNMESAAEFDGAENIIREFNFAVSDDRWQHMLDYMNTNLGKPYSVWSICKLACMYAGRKLGINIPDPERTGHSAFICSEIGADLCNIALGDIVPDDRVITPRDLYNKLSGISE